MKRRSFIKSILGAVASVALAQKIALQPVNISVDGIPFPAPNSPLTTEVLNQYYKTLVSESNRSDEIYAVHMSGQPPRFNWTGSKWEKVA